MEVHVVAVAQRHDPLVSGLFPHRSRLGMCQVVGFTRRAAMQARLAPDEVQIPHRANPVRTLLDHSHGGVSSGDS